MGAAEAGGGSGSALAGLADALADTLPSGSRVVVRWRDPEAGDGVSAGAGATSALHAHAQAGLDGRPASGNGSEIDVAWDEGDTRIAIHAL